MGNAARAGDTGSAGSAGEGGLEALRQENERQKRRISELEAEVASLKQVSCQKDRPQKLP